MLQSTMFRSMGILILVLVSGWASARSLSDLDAVHQSAQLRTLAMRVARTHIQAASGDQDTGVWQALNGDVVRYDDTLARLEENSPSSVINQRILKVKALWRQYKTTALSRPSRTTVNALLDAGDNLLVQTDALVKLWQARLPHDRGERNDLALQQGMLSERIGLFYAAQAYGIHDNRVRDELRYSMRAFEQGMGQLQAAASEVQDSRLLALLRNQWTFARQGLKQRADAGTMTVAMETLYQQSNELGDRFRDEDRLVMNAASLPIGLAANVTAD